MDEGLQVSRFLACDCTICHGGQTHLFLFFKQHFLVKANILRMKLLRRKSKLGVLRIFDKSHVFFIRTWNEYKIFMEKSVSLRRWDRNEISVFCNEGLDGIESGTCPKLNLSSLDSLLLMYIFAHICGPYRPPLWSSGQSFWLQIQRSRVRFPALPDFLISSGSIEELLE